MFHVVKVGTVSDGSMIHKIKALRTAFSTPRTETGEVFNSMGLKDAKESVEHMNSGEYITFTLDERQIQILKNNGFQVHPLDEKRYEQAETAKYITIFRENNGRKIDAIKDLRWALNLGLKETKDLMDEMWAINCPVEFNVSLEQVHKLQQRGFTVTGFSQEYFEEDLFLL